MATNYPNALDTTTQLPNSRVSGNTIQASDQNNQADAILAIEAELGVAPSGTYATVKDRFDALVVGGGSAGLPVIASDYQTAGVSDETALLLAADAACDNGRALYIPRRAAEWVTSVPIPIVASIEVFGYGTVIRQSTWRKPVFDLETTDDVDVHHFYLRSTATRTSGAGSFRGDDEDRYGAGVWGAGDRCKARHLRVEGLDSAVHFTNWTTGSTHSGTPVGNRVENIQVATVDFGVLFVSQANGHIENIAGSYVASSGSADPGHLVYAIGLGANACTNLTGGNWRAYDSTAAPAFQLRSIDGGELRGLVARNCGGLMTFDGLTDFHIDGLSSTNDQRADEVGSLGAITGSCVRARFTSVLIEKSVSGRAVAWNGTDCEIDGLTVVANRTSQNFNEDIKLDGTRNRIKGLRHRNAGSTTTGAEAVNVVATAVDCEVLDPEIRNANATTGSNNAIVIRSGATRTRVHYDTDLLIASGAGLKVNDSGTGSIIKLSPGSGGGGSAHTIEDETSALTQRTKLSLQGATVKVTDDAGNDRTIVTIGDVETNTQTGTAYTLAIGDRGKVVEMNNASSNTVTIPPNSSVAFPVGTVLEVYQMGAGQTTLAAGAGVTLRSRGGALGIAGQYGSATARKRATDEWVIAGDVQ